jgi:8-oxo-dGTP pyrophosphatase MutT (NUDIX family)
MYTEKYELFKKRYINGNGRERINQALRNSSNINETDLYELPKGHQNECEMELDGAVREFEEETSLKIKHVRFVSPDGNRYEYEKVRAHSRDFLQPIRHEFTAPDNHQLYTTYFYVAITDTPIRPSIKIDGIHPIEIADIAWVSVNNSIVKKYTDVLRDAIKRVQLGTSE